MRGAVTSPALALPPVSDAARSPPLSVKSMGVGFRIDYLQLLSPSGELLEAAEEAGWNTDVLRSLYQAMTRTRVFDAKAVALQRTGQLGTFASALGQEAIGVGTAYAMLPGDLLVPSYRDHAAQLLRGVTMAEVLLYWGGDERGSDFKNARRDFPNCVPVATQVAHAVGAAYAFRLRREKHAVACFIGDGGTGNGAFYEALNMAGVWKAPVVIVINNNGWAISTPRERECAAQTLAQKAFGAGVEGRQIDGNDVLAVYKAAQQALERAREGDGPTLIEAVSYRLGDHTTADDATRYRNPDEVKEAWTKEPIGRLRTFLVGRRLWDKEKEEALQKQCAREVEEAVAAYAATSPRGCEAMFDHLFHSLPASMKDQLEEARRFDPMRRNGHG
jgi:2-oxoisovalerate dehydrogenase E1 component alpha subunit